MDVGIYALQACRYLTGLEPELITATETKTDPVKFAEVEETLAWTMKMGNVTCSCNTSYAFFCVPAAQYFLLDSLSWVHFVLFLLSYFTVNCCLKRLEICV